MGQRDKTLYTLAEISLDRHRCRFVSDWIDSTTLLSTTIIEMSLKQILMDSLPLEALRLPSA
jgi:hypothetical protein